MQTPSLWRHAVPVHVISKYPMQAGAACLVRRAEIVVACQFPPPLKSRVVVRFEGDDGGLDLAGAVRVVHRLRTGRGAFSAFSVRVDSLIDVPGEAQLLGPQRAALVAC